MGVVMYLYKVRPDVTYLGYRKDNLKISDFDCDVGLPEKFTVQEYFRWIYEMERNSWSDKSCIRDVINLNWIKARYANFRGKKSTMNKLKDFQTITYNTSDGPQKVIPVDIIQHASGWFFKQSFITKKVALYVATTKKQMETFFRRYLTYNDPVYNVYEITKRFLYSWEDGMIFLCSF